MPTVTPTPEEQAAQQKQEERRDKLHENYLRRKASGAYQKHKEKFKEAKRNQFHQNKAAIRAEDKAKGVFFYAWELPKSEPKVAQATWKHS